MGSDLDLVVIVRDGSEAPLFDGTRLPVPADVVVFKEARWAQARVYAGTGSRKGSEHSSGSCKL